jgi:cellulose synthase/poly-beta-1,6-N-acetylglucosamine synthase-like glycosyltransferase
MVKTVTDLHIPVTAVGNNMMISRKAYESVGGYENIPFSVTEDFQLFKETLKKGWSYRNLLNEEVLAYSKPTESFPHLIKQRKRWMTGALQLPLILVICLITQSVFFPVILYTMFVFPLWGGLIWIIKIILQQVFIALVMRKMNAWAGLQKYFILFEIYSSLLSAFLLLYYVLPFKVEWKGRRY